MRVPPRFYILALLGCLGCANPAPTHLDYDGDGSADAEDCSPSDPTVHPGAIDTCDGVDSDCDGVVDSDPSVVHQYVHEDADGDGWGHEHHVNTSGCLRPGWIPEAADYDCDDQDSAANPDHPELCDSDHDGVVAATDCDDDDVYVHPNASERCNGVDDDCDGLVDDADPDTALEPTTPMYGLDADHDGYTPLGTIASCTLPPGDYALMSGDCDDGDETVNPGAFDDCATATDRDCSGAFEPVVGYGIEAGTHGPQPSIAELFTRAGPSDAPTVIEVHGVIHACPGTYRVRLVFGAFSLYTKYGALIGLGDSPDDVVLDAAGAGRNVVVRNWADLDQEGPTDVDLASVTFRGGTSAESGGCLELSTGWAGPNTVHLDSVVFEGCHARRGGAVHVANTSSLTADDVSFVDCHASVAGGAMSIEGGFLGMSGGGFTTCTAPSGYGAAVALTLTSTNTAAFELVDFGAVTDDVQVTFGTARYVRELGASSSVVFDAAHPGGL